MSGMPKYAQRRDHNEPALLKAAKVMGARIYISGPLDGWAHHANTGWIPFEIKNGESARYTPAQKDFLQWCQAWRMPVATWRTQQDVINTFQGTDTWKPSTPMPQNNSPADTPSAQSVKIAERCL